MARKKKTAEPKPVELKLLPWRQEDEDKIDPCARYDLDLDSDLAKAIAEAEAHADAIAE